MNEVSPPTHTRSRRRAVAALAALPLVGLSLLRNMAEPARAAKNKRRPRPTPTPTPTGDFSIGTRHTGSVTESDTLGYLVRGGSVGPQYALCSFGCTWVTDQISVASRNGFEGDITLAVLNLPAGVASQTAPSIFLPARSARLTAFKLTAAGNAALGTTTVTIRGTSGAIEDAINRQIEVVDELPICESAC